MEQPKKHRIAVWLIPLLICIIVLMLLCACCAFLPLTVYFVQAKGQPGTVIPPKPAQGAADTSVSLPKDLAASATADSINLTWSKNAGAVSKYRVYRSERIDTGYTALAEVVAPDATYSDKAVAKGITYYYVVTALSVAGAESANSNAISSIIDAPPLVPKGVYSWSDAKAKAEADTKYLALLTEVTSLKMNDLSRLADKEKQGQTFKRTLPQGTIVTNTTEDYRILPNYTLKTDREALTDEDGTPYVLTRCGNPMRLKSLPPPLVIQWTQTIVTTFYWEVLVIVLPEDTLIDMVTTTPEVPETKVSDQIVGTWAVQDASTAGFPVNITFDAQGGVSFTVAGIEGVGDVTVSGTYEFTDDNHITLREPYSGQTWSYEVSISGDVLTLTYQGQSLNLHRTQ